MSAFLGPIHYWLYKQIKIVEQREEKLVSEFSSKYSAEKVDDLIYPYRVKYGELKEDKDLTELVAGKDIHSWLEAAVDSAQSREAAVIAALFDEYSDLELLEKVFSEQAVELAEKAKIRDDQEKFELEELFEIINEHFVERMPCDRLSGAVKEEAKIIWKHKSQLHQEFWQKTKVELDLMHKLYAEWLSVFTEELNPAVAHQREVEADYYNDIFYLK